MQSDQAKELRRRHAETPCKHPSIEKEYDRGAHTGDYVCSVCGWCFGSREEWEQEKISASQIDVSGVAKIAEDILRIEKENMKVVSLRLSQDGWLLLNRCKFTQLDAASLWAG